MSDVQVMVRPRQAGKTTALVSWLLEDRGRRVIVTATEDQAREIREKHGLSERWVVSAGTNLRGRNVVALVDDAELCLARLLGVPVERLTVTGETA